jgi:hypothetical protein
VEKINSPMTLHNQYATTVVLGHQQSMAALAVFHVHLEKQERRVCSAKLENFAHQKLNKVKKRIRRSVYLVQKEVIKTKKGWHIVFHVFLEDSIML